MPDGAEVGRGYVVVSPSMRGFGSSVSAQTSAVATESGKKGGKLFGEFWAKSSLGPLKAVGEGAAVILGLDKAFEFAKSSIGVAREAQVTQGQVAQAILSTGGAANVSSGHVEEYAKSLSDATGVSKLQIEAGERMLLTYTNVANQVGKGNDIFDRATKTANDFAVAQGVSLPSAMRVVGRALNDPIKGTALLTRYGAGLSVQTIATIKSLVAQGKTLEAQKIILNSLNERFGGSAKAADNWGKQFSTAVENVKERVGQDLIPVIDGIEKATVKTLIPGLEKGGTAVGHFIDSLGHNSTVVATFHDIDGAVVAIVRSVGNLGGALAPAAKDLLDIGGAAVIGGLGAVAVVLDGTAHAAEAVTGFFKDNRVAAYALAGVIAGALLPSVAGLVIAFGASAIETFGATMYAIIGPIIGAATAFAEADTAALGFGAALDTLDLNPVGAALVVVGAVVGVLTGLFHHNSDSAADAAKSVNVYTNALTDMSDGAKTATQTALGSFEQLSTMLIATNPMGKGLDIVSQSAQSLDKSLTGLVTGGKAPAAAAGFDQITASLRSAGLSTAQITALFPQYTAALADSASQARASGTGIDSYGNAVSAAAKKTESATDAAKKYSDELHALTDPLFAMNQALADLKTKQDAATKATAKYGAGSRQAKQANLDLASSSLDVEAAAKTLAANVDDGSVSLGKARRELRGWTQDGLLTKKQAHSVAQSFGGLIDKADKIAAPVQDSGKKMAHAFDAVPPAVRHVIGEVLSALDKSSAASSKGVLLTQGFAAGMSSNNALVAVGSAAAAVISFALSALDHHGKKNSPYHAFNPNGESATGGFAVGMVSPASLAVLDSAAKTVISHAADAMTDAQAEHELKHLTKGVGSFVTAWQKDLSKELGAKSITKQFADEQEKNAKAFESSWTHRLDTVGARLTVLDNRYKSTESTAKSFASGITSNLTGGLSLGNAGTATVAGGIGFLSQENTGLSAFMHNLDTMRRKGFSSALVDDIAQEGLDQGGPLAASYAHATAAQVKRLNTLERHARATSRLIGSDAEQQTYGRKLDRQLTALHKIENKIGTIGNQVVSAENKVDKHSKLKKKTSTGKPA